MNFFKLDGSKSEVFETSFVDSVTTKNDHQMYATHVLGPIYVFFTLLGYWARGGVGVSQGIGRLHNLPMQFSHWTTQN